VKRYLSKGLRRETIAHVPQTAGYDKVQLRGYNELAAAVNGKMGGIKPVSPVSADLAVSMKGGLKPATGRK